MRETQDKSEEYSNFPRKLETLRFRLRLTQEEMGQRLGIAANYVYMLERGMKRPGPKLLQRVSQLEKEQELAESGFQNVNAPTAEDLQNKLLEIKAADAGRFRTLASVIDTFHELVHREDVPLTEKADAESAADQTVSKDESLPGIDEGVADVARSAAPVAVRKALHEHREYQRKQKAVLPSGNKDEPGVVAGPRPSSQPGSGAQAPKERES